MNLNSMLLAEKYAPHSVKDCFLPMRISTELNSYLEGNDPSSLIFYGSPGVGKSSTAKAFLSDANIDFIKINGSLNLSMDVMRNTVTEYASTMSLNGGRKGIIIDEADGMFHTSQEALRSFMDDYTGNCLFVFTANNLSKIAEPLRSRCAVLDFNLTKEERRIIANKFLKRIEEILVLEKVKNFERSFLIDVIKNTAPDWRKILNVIQQSINNKTIANKNYIESAQDLEIDLCFEHLSKKDWNGMRKWVLSVKSIARDDIFNNIFKMIEVKFSDKSKPIATCIVAKYKFQSNFDTDFEITLSACLSELMMEI